MREPARRALARRFLRSQLRSLVWDLVWDLVRGLRKGLASPPHDATSVAKSASTGVGSAGRVPGRAIRRPRRVKLLKRPGTRRCSPSSTTVRKPRGCRRLLHRPTARSRRSGQDLVTNGQDDRRRRAARAGTEKWSFAWLDPSIMCPRAFSPRVVHKVFLGVVRRFRRPSRLLRRFPGPKRRPAFGSTRAQGSWRWVPGA